MWKNHRDEPSNTLSSNSESFKYKKSITQSTYNIVNGEDGYDAKNVGKNETEIFVPLKYLSNFWRTSNIPSVNCETELILTWSKSCALINMTVRAAVNNNDPPTIVEPTGL